MSRTPTVGDSVHVTLGGHCRAAIVTAGVGTRLGIGVTVFHPDGGVEGLKDVPQPASVRKERTWHWPETTSTGRHAAPASPIPPAAAVTE